MHIHQALVSAAICILASACALIAMLGRSLARVRYEADHDGLTGVLRRPAVHRAHERRSRKGQPSVAIMVDLDDFKGINDWYGHRAGDQVLAVVGARLSTQAGSLGGIAARLGGDEFAVLAPMTHTTTSDQAIIALLEALAQPIVVDGLSGSDVVCPSASAGIATAPPQRTWTELLQAADSALIEAKKRHTRYATHASLQTVADTPAPPASTRLAPTTQPSSPLTRTRSASRSRRPSKPQAVLAGQDLLT